MALDSRKAPPSFCGDVTDFEFHIPGMNFCGPGTNLNSRLENDGKTPKFDSRPVDRVDEIALRHDLFYGEHKGAELRCHADKEMIEELKKSTILLSVKELNE